MLNEAVVNHVYLAQGNTDLRKSIDGLAALVQQEFELDPSDINAVDQLLPWSTTLPVTCIA